MTGLQTHPQRAQPQRDRATKLKRRCSFPPAPLRTNSARGARQPPCAPTSVRAGGSSRATDSVYAACRSLSAQCRLNAGRVTHCAARLLLGRSAHLSAPCGSRHGASRSSGVPPPRSVDTCLSGVCRRLGLAPQTQSTVLIAGGYTEIPVQSSNAQQNVELQLRGGISVRHEELSFSSVPYPLSH
ncbi:hypothetical protein NDU88_001783 [Pleurodeles waltl]|uniref:Uncharacterized protein n=1 Tax=Pleurodeles waltl TaxID=8319 RepID=A0AAV7T0K1_PLEWA|nr:hypothetical protein NDU88_001783 [Pleurodeles waltl]